MTGPFTPEIAAEVDAAVLCWMATVDDAGRPNVSPKEMFRVHDDARLLIAEIASARSMRNVRHLFEVTATRVTPILAPSYVKHPERTEEYFLQNAYDLYGVRPK